MLNPRRAMLLGVVAFLVLGSWLVLRQTDAPENDSALNQSAQADYYLSDSRLRVHDKQGVLRYEVTSSSAEHFPQTRQTQLSEVAMVFSPQQDDVWFLTARTATLPDDRDAIAELVGEVKLHATSNKGDRLHLSTPRMQVLPDTEKLWTDSGVLIQGRGVEISAQRLEAHMSTQRLQLAGQVQTRYAVETP